MSDYESHSGKIRKVQPQDNELFEDTCKRLWLENGKSEEDYCEGELFNEFYKKYINVNDESIWEIFEHQDLGEEEDMFCRLHDNKDGTFSFHTRYYNGGTCMTEMIADSLEEKEKLKYKL